MRRGFAAALGLGLAVAAGHVHGAAPQSPRLAIDVRVLDLWGTPVSDLTPADFLLTVDEHPRTVADAVFVGPEDPEPRTFILGVDQTSFRSSFDPAAREAARRLVDLVPSSDALGLVLFPGATPLVPSRDRVRVRAALGRISSRWAELSEAERVTQSVDGILAAIAHAGALPGRKTLVLASAGIALPIISQGTSPSRFAADTIRVAQAAEAADVTIYTMFMNAVFLQKFGASLVGLTLGDDLERQGRFLHAISIDTGGRFYQLEPGPGPFVERIVRAARSYYRVTFELSPPDRDGKPHKIEVHQKARDTGPPTSVHTRTMVTIPRS